MTGKAKRGKKGKKPSPAGRQLGALELRAINVPGLKRRFIPWVLADGTRLFVARTCSEITALKKRLEELGLADLLEPLPEPRSNNAERWENQWNLAQKEVEDAARICAALEAKAASIETFGEDVPPDGR